jgi:hypothetical protein
MDTEFFPWVPNWLVILGALVLIACVLAFALFRGGAYLAAGVMWLGRTVFGTDRRKHRMETEAQAEKNRESNKEAQARLRYLAHTSEFDGQAWTMWRNGIYDRARQWFADHPEADLLPEGFGADLLEEARRKQREQVREAAE